MNTPSRSKPPRFRHLENQKGADEDVCRPHIVYGIVTLILTLAISCCSDKVVNNDDKTAPSAIVDLVADSSSSSSVNLSWISPGDDGDVGTASKYDIRYSTSHIDSSNWAAATECTGEPSPQVAGSSQSFVVTGLDENTAYHFAVRTADEASNWSGLSNEASSKTKPSHYITWERTYGGHNDEFANAVAVVPDGGYVLAGDTYSFGPGDVYLIKVDEYGNLLWQNTYGGSLQEIIRSLSVTPDGGYIMAGEAGLTDIFDDTLDAYFVRVDGSGNLLWEKKYSGIGIASAMAAISEPDGGSIAVGWTGSLIFTDNYYYSFIMKLDDSGEIVWMTPLDDTLDAAGLSPMSLTATPDGGYLVLDQYLRIVKLDGSGNILWQIDMDFEGAGFATSLVASTDGGYVVTGYAYPDGADSLDVFLLKFDRSGNLIWMKTYGGNRDDYSCHVIRASDGGYIVAGWTFSFGAGNDDVYLLKVDESGNLLWERIFGGLGYDLALSVAVAPDGGYIVGARTFPGGPGTGDFFLIKTDPNGEL